MRPYCARARMVLAVFLGIAMADSDTIKLNLRLSKGLHARLVKMAKRNNVSLNTEIVNQLEGYEAATINRIAKIMQPLLDEAVKASASVGSEVAAKSVLEVLKDAAPLADRDLDQRLRRLADLLDHLSAKAGAD